MGMPDEFCIIMAECIFTHTFQLLISSESEALTSVHAKQHLSVFLELPTIFSIPYLASSQYSLHKIAQLCTLQEAKTVLVVALTYQWPGSHPLLAIRSQSCAGFLSYWQSTSFLGSLPASWIQLVSSHQQPRSRFVFQLARMGFGPSLV